MGHALAEQLSLSGCDVELISGPGINGHAQVPYKVTKVTSANDMFTSVKEKYNQVDIAIFAAAVADYRPEEVATQKIKKQDEAMTIKLVKNKDIAKEMGMLKTSQFNVGFALETENEKVNAQQKLKNKNFDMIVLNSLNDRGAGFAHDTNKVTIIDRHNNQQEFELKSKVEVAKDIVNEIAKAL